MLLGIELDMAKAQSLTRHRRGLEAGLALAGALNGHLSAMKLLFGADSTTR